MSNPDQLSELLQQAEKTAQKQSKATTRTERRPIPVGTILGVAVLLALGYAGSHLMNAILPPSEAVVEQDVDAVLRQAQQAVEAARSENGRLPDAVPNAALSNVVEYKREQNTYQLTATVLGVRVTLTSDGQKKTERAFDQ